MGNLKDSMVQATLEQRSEPLPIDRLRKFFQEFERAQTQTTYGSPVIADTWSDEFVGLTCRRESLEPANTANTYLMQLTFANKEGSDDGIGEAWISHNNPKEKGTFLCERDFRRQQVAKHIQDRVDSMIEFPEKYVINEAMHRIRMSFDCLQELDSMKFERPDDVIESDKNGYVTDQINLAQVLHMGREFVRIANPAELDTFDKLAEKHFPETDPGLHVKTPPAEIITDTGPAPHTRM